MSNSFLQEFYFYMKNTNLFIALAISATLMIATSGCKHGRVGTDHIPGTTVVPSPIENGGGKDTDRSRADRSGRDNVNPIVPIVSEPVVTEIKPEPPKPVDMGFEGTNKWTDTWEKGNLTPDAIIFEKDIVYFELDSAVIRKNEQSKLEDIANFFKTNTNDVLMVEGHCDERGTEQYNLALGDRRSLAVREYLANLGVEPARIHTVSFGESRPVDPGHNEAAWSKNRRGVSILMRVSK